MNKYLLTYLLSPKIFVQKYFIVPKKFKLPKICPKKSPKKSLH